MRVSSAPALIWRAARVQVPGRAQDPAYEPARPVRSRGHRDEAKGRIAAHSGLGPADLPVPTMPSALVMAG
jgi:hypothetical protein